MFKFNKELVFYDEKIAPICLVADLLGFITLGVYVVLGPLLSPAVTAVVLKVASHFSGVAVLLSVAFLFVWMKISWDILRYSIKRSKRWLIVLTHVVNIAYIVSVVEWDLPM